MIAASNPILPGCHPDPSICRVGHEFFLVTSTFEYLPGLPIHRSTDLVNWELIGHAIDRPGMIDMTGLASSSGLYAPTLRHHDGRFWLVCTLVDQTDPARGGNFVITATDAAGPWSDPVWLDADGIDPSLFFDDDGTAWAHGTRPARDPQWHDQTEIWLREFDPVSMTLVGPEHVLWSGAVIGAVWAEGPHIYKVDGRYHLVAAEGGTEMNHAVMVARADAVTGPYAGAPANPVLSHRQQGRTADVVAVGHADLVQAADGSWWAVVLGMRPYGGLHANLGRETFLVPVVWEDGWPVFAPGEGRVPETVEVPFAGSAAVAAAPARILPGDLRWTSVRVLPAEVADAEGDGWLLPVRPEGPADLRPFAFLGVRQEHADVDVRLTLSGRLGGEEEGGLLIRQSEQDQLRLAVHGGAEEGAVRITAALVRTGVVVEQRATLLPASLHDGVELILRARGQDYELLAGAAGSRPAEIMTADGRSLDSFSAGGFLGLWIGVYATSRGTRTDSILRIESFEYRPRQ